MIEITTSRSSNRFNRAFGDFALGLAVYASLLVFATYASPEAATGALPLFTSSANAADGERLVTIYRSTDQRQATLILGLAFASLTAFNLAVLRHLRRVYASPR